MSKNISEPPTYSDSANAAMQLLYQSLQDIDIFVEDPSLKEVYNELIHGFSIEGLRFFSVIPLGERDNLLLHSANSGRERPSCYFVDGDLTYAAKDEAFEDDRIYVHDCYCFENYLINNEACCYIVLEQWGNINYQEAEEKVQWDVFCKEIEATLVPLFIVYAAAHQLDISIQTVGRGFGAVTVENRGTRRLDKKRIDSEIKRVDSEIRKSVCPNRFSSAIIEIEKRVTKLDEPISIVSGKDYLLPLLIQRIHAICKPKMTRESFIMRLLRNCKQDRFVAMREFVLKQVNK